MTRTIFATVFSQTLCELKQLKETLPQWNSLHSMTKMIHIFDKCQISTMRGGGIQTLKYKNNTMWVTTRKLFLRLSRRNQSRCSSAELLLQIQDQYMIILHLLPMDLLAGPSSHCFPLSRSRGNKCGRTRWTTATAFNRNNSYSTNLKSALLASMSTARYLIFNSLSPIVPEQAEQTLVLHYLATLLNQPIQWTSLLKLIWTNGIIPPIYRKVSWS